MININELIIIISTFGALISMIFAFINIIKLHTYLYDKKPNVLKKYKSRFFPEGSPSLFNMDITWGIYIFKINKSTDNDEIIRYKRIFQISFLIGIIFSILVFIFFPGNT